MRTTTLNLDTSSVETASVVQVVLTYSLSSTRRGKEASARFFPMSLSRRKNWRNSYSGILNILLIHHDQLNKCPGYTTKWSEKRRLKNVLLLDALKCYTTSSNYMEEKQKTKKAKRKET